MELRHLRYFAAVADELNVTRAAERLGIAQPPLSQQIARLEAELGVKLLRRVPRGVELTEPGRIFLGEAKRVLEQADHAVASAQRAAAGEIGRLRLGLSGATSFHPSVRRILRAYCRANPDVDLTVDEAGSASLLEGVLEDRIDVALLLQPAARPKELAFETLVSDELVAVVPTGLARKRGRLPLSELAEETFVFIPREVGPGLYDALISACLEAGFSPRLGQATTRMVSAIHLASSGLGVTLAPAWMTEFATEGVEYRRLSGTSQRLTVELTSRRGNVPPSVRKFVEVARR